MVTCDAPGLSPDISFIEMLDIVNAKLKLAGEEPIAFDRIMQAGGFISVNTGGTPDANCLPVSKGKAELSMDAAACIGCGACVASCKNASAMLFVSAKVAQFAYLPQGQPERYDRAQRMIAATDHNRVRQLHQPGGDAGGGAQIRLFGVAARARPDRPDSVQAHRDRFCRDGSAFEGLPLRPPTRDPPCQGLPLGANIMRSRFGPGVVSIRQGNLDMARNGS
jgi:ferredoxin